jgi:hypothetical protein
MEVHAHTHTPRKKWTHYFWEFLMLFLAVFCGFLAEYQLEHKIERDREKQYIKSFGEDLAADTAEFNLRISFCDLTIKVADSLIFLPGHPQKNEMAGDIYYYFRFIHRNNPFTVNDRTIVQLRNAGGMRLVSNKQVSDSMINYYKASDLLKYLDEEQMDMKKEIRPQFNKILYAEDFAKVVDNRNRVIRTNETLRLKPCDEESTNTLKLSLELIRGINQGIKIRLFQLKEKATVIRMFIKEEYHLK